MLRRLSSDRAFGRAVAAGRKLIGFEQTGLAALANVSGGTISNVESGRPSRRTTKKAIMQALQIKGVRISGRGGMVLGDSTCTFTTVSVSVP